MLDNIKRLVKGSLLAKLVGIAVMPLITRLYAPEDMGIAAVFTSFVLIVGPLLNLRYCLALPLPKRSATAVVILIASIATVLVLGVGLVVIVYLFGTKLVDVFGLVQIEPYLYMAIFASVLMSIFEVLSWWVTRVKEFKVYSQVMVIQSLIVGGAKLGFGVLSPGPLSLIVSSMLQNLWGSIKFTVLFSESMKLRRVSICRIFQILSYYANYAYLKTPAHVMFVVAAQLPIFYGVRMHSIGDVGQLSLAMSVIAIPAAILGQSVSKVYYSEISSLGRDKPNEIYRLTVSTLKKLALIGFVGSFFVYVLSPFVFQFVFGESWGLAGLLSKALAPVVVFQFCAAALMTSLNVFLLNYLSFFLHLTRLVLVAACFILAEYISLELVEAIFLYSLFLMLHYFFTTTVILLKIKKRVNNECRT